ncbi:hypothetical protein HC031_31625 [Planosporangium thailandense]|uniref:Mce-associated membrane protein n=1 Tax=Planosporangium thailandense TaxID=765197 RepID=A0ABX0Y9N5_9ACTN|nr:hypothetical protein [Planosporangium thailandense]NJC74230.1 hypothetical protein [Planosporangium thailandense]
MSTDETNSADGVEEPGMSTPTRSTAELRRLARRRTVVRRPPHQSAGTAAEAADSGATLVDNGPAVTDSAAVPVDAAPTDTAPVDTAPVDAAPVDAAPVDAAPVDAAPVDAAPADAAPVDAVPADAAPAERDRAARRSRRSSSRTRSGGGARRGPGLLVVGLLVLLVAAIAAAGWGGYGWYQRQQLDAAHQQALAAARQTTVNFVSVSAKTVDRDLQRVTTGATGDFKDEFSRGAAQVRAAVVENNVDSRGSVLRAALVSGDTDSAVVLVAVDATVKNVKVPQGRLSHYRIQVNMTKDAKSGRWLVAKLQFVG